MITCVTFSYLPQAPVAAVTTSSDDAITKRGRGPGQRWHDEPGVPPGFSTYTRDSPFLARAVGPMFASHRGDLWILGLRVAPHHVNARGAVHGGLLSTIADVGLGHAIALADDTSHPTTVSLAVDYLDLVRLDAWLEVRTRVLHIGGRLAFSRAEIYGNDTIVARANGTFALARPNAERRGRGQ